MAARDLPNQPDEANAPLTFAALVGRRSSDGKAMSVALTDDGYVKIDGASGGSGGTQYTEDAAAAANPVGTALILVREDARAGSLTTTDGDNVAARGNNKGELYVKDTDVGASFTAVTGTKAPGTAAASALLTGGVYSATPPTLTDGQQAALLLDARNGLYVVVKAPGTNSTWAAANPGGDGQSNAVTSMIVTGYTSVYNPATSQWDRLRGNATGGAFMQGPAAAGSAIAGNPVLMGGSDGTNARAIATDTNGNVKVVGSGGGSIPVQGHAANGAAVGANPNLTAGYDGTNVRTILTDTGGRQVLAPIGLAASASFTPAASSHTAGDVNGGAQQFSLGAPSGAVFMITGVSLEIDGGTAEATAWTLHLYSVTPPSATADDGAWDLPSGDRASYLGQINLGTAVDQGSTQWIETNNVNKAVKLSGTSVFGYLVNASTLTPANVVHKVTLIGTPL